MNFLIVKTSSLGDIVQAFPVLEYLRKRFPTANIDWVVEKPFAELVQAHPFVDRVLSIDTKTWRRNFNSNTRKEVAKFHSRLHEKRYEAVFDLQGNIKSGIVTFMSKAKHKVGFGYKTVAEWPNIFFTWERFNPPPGLNIRDVYLEILLQYFKDKEPSLDETDAPKILLKITPEQSQQITDILERPELKSKPRYMICPGSAWKNKRISTPVLIEFAKKVQENFGNSFLWVWGTEEERKEVEQLYAIFKESSIIVPRLALPVLQHLMNRVEIVVAVDSLPLHLAGMTSTATFSIFGPTQGFKYAPKGHRHLMFQGECPYERTFEKRCPVLRTCPTGACIKTLSADDIFWMFSMIAGAKLMD